MDGMTLNASYIVKRVGRRVNIGAFEAGRMAAQTCIEALLGRERRECNDGRLASVRFDVRLARTVAAFASRVLGLLLAARNAYKVSIFVEFEPDIRMADLAGYTAHKSRRLHRVATPHRGRT